MVYIHTVFIETKFSDVLFPIFLLHNFYNSVKHE
jgi:hypothetical protein